MSKLPKTRKDIVLIGRGAFTKAYLTDDSKVLLDSVCPIKECMANGWFPDSDLFPEIEHLDEYNVGYRTYIMPYYEKVTNPSKQLDPDQHAIYKELREIGHAQINLSICKSTLYFFDFWHKEFNKIKNQDLRDIMKEALDACGNYGTDIMFEISPRNIAVKKGKLVLLDCFASVRVLKDIRG